jgi:hypothetical protein
LVGELKERGKLHSWFVQVYSLVGGVALLLLVLARPVIDENSAHLRLFLSPVLASLLGVVGGLAGGIVWGRLIHVLLLIRGLRFGVCVTFIETFLHLQPNQ